MNSIGKVVRRALSRQGVHGIEPRRGFVSCASSSTASSFQSNSPFGICGQKRGLKGLTKFKAKSAGRNSSGRITIFHRGGGAKRLQRRIDLKRSVASMGIVERVEYDPNRAARIALVRWSDVQVPRQKRHDKPDKYAILHKTIDLSTTTIRGTFTYSMLPGIRKVDAYQPNKLYPKEVFFSAFSAPNGNSGETLPPLPLPRIAIAGANPRFLALRVIKQNGSKDDSSLCEVRKCIPNDSVLWAHRIEPKAAVSWTGPRMRESFGMVTPRATTVAKKPVYHKVDGK